MAAGLATHHWLNEVSNMEESKYLKYPLGKVILKSILKFIVFLLVVGLVFALGLIIGYAVIGKGHVWAVFNQDTWRHIMNFLN